jgi:hypothetical protein
MAALGDKPAAKITLAEVEALLRTVAATGVSARSVNRAREGTTKTGHVRRVPMDDQAAAALDRLSQRQDFLSPDDYVFCNALGRPLDGSALRRRYQRARDTAGCARCAGMTCATPSARCWSPEGRPGEHQSRDRPLPADNHQPLPPRAPGNGTRSDVHRRDRRTRLVALRSSPATPRLRRPRRHSSRRTCSRQSNA